MDEQLYMLSGDAVFMRNADKRVVFHRKNLNALSIDREAETFLKRFQTPMTNATASDAFNTFLRLGFIVSVMPRAYASQRVQPRKNIKLTTYRIVLTEACNYNCNYCFEHTTTDRASTMDSRTLEASISKILSHHDAGDSINIHWFGGEPLLRFRQIKEGVRQFSHAIQRGEIAFVSNDLTTHGGLVTDAVAHFMVENNFRVLISLDGNKDIHDQNRIDNKGRGTYHAGVRAFQLLQSYGVDVGIIVTPAQNTLSSLADNVLHLVSEFKPSRIHINTPQPTAKGWDVDGQVLAEQLFRCTQACMLQGVEMVGPDQKILRALALNDVQELDCVAPTGDYAVSIAPDGSLGYCIVSWNEEGHQDPEGRWSIESAARWKTVDHKTDKCRQCIAEAVCGGPCPLEASFDTLNPERCAFYLTYLEKALLQ